MTASPEAMDQALRIVDLSEQTKHDVISVRPGELRFAIARALDAARTAGIEAALLAVAEEGLDWPEGTGGREGIKRACAAIRALKEKPHGD